MKRIPFLDSHTGGEPTRLIETPPFDLGTGSVADKLSRLKKDHDDFRTTVLNEPRGSDVLVGALLVPPNDPTCQFGVIYFNNVGYLGMCGHGTIGLIASLAYRGRVTEERFGWRLLLGCHSPHPSRAFSLRGRRRWWHYPNRVLVKNIPAYRHLTHVPVTVDGKTIHGDVAWGGNWFFLAHDHGLDVNMKNLEALTEFAWRVREQLTANGITGANGAEIDHIELFAPASTSLSTESRRRQQKFCHSARQSLTAPLRHRHQRKSSPVYTPMENCRRVKPGNNKASSAVSSRQCAIGWRKYHPDDHRRSMGHGRGCDSGG